MSTFAFVDSDLVATKATAQIEIWSQEIDKYYTEYQSIRDEVGKRFDKFGWFSKILLEAREEYIDGCTWVDDQRLGRKIDARKRWIRVAKQILQLTEATVDGTIMLSAADAELLNISHE